MEESLDQYPCIRVRRKQKEQLISRGGEEQGSTTENESQRKKKKSGWWRTFECCIACNIIRSGVLIDNNVLDVKLYNSVVTGPNTWSPHTFRQYITLASLSTELQVSSR